MIAAGVFVFHVGAVHAVGRTRRHRFFGPSSGFKSFLHFLSFENFDLFFIPPFFRASRPHRSRSSSKAWTTRCVLIPSPLKEALECLSFPKRLNIRTKDLTIPLFQEWQSSLYSLLQNQTFNQVEVDLFELMCKVLDQNLFAQVDWARNSYYFKELKVGTNSAPFK